MPRQHDAAAPAESAEMSSAWFRRFASWGALCATLLAPALAGWALLRPAGAAPGAAQIWLLGLAVALTCVAVGWTLWRQAALEAALRGAREEARAARQLGTAWAWEADAGHRLVAWRAPEGAMPGGAESPLPGRPLWEAFGADAQASASLRARMEAGLPLCGQRVALAPVGAATEGMHHFSLEGRPLTDALGRVARWIGTAQPAPDGSESGEHERRLLQALLSALPLPVFELAGDAQGVRQVRRANAAAAQCAGAKADELAGLPFADLLARLPADLRAGLASAIARPQSGVAESTLAGWQFKLQEVAAPVEDGTRTAERCWLLVLLPSARTDGAAAGAPAPDAESFSYTVSHDLRAPVRVVEGFTKILKEDYGRQLDRIGNDHLDRVLGAAARMNAMIDALLALAQLSSRPLSRQPVNLSQLAAYVLEDLRRQSPERQVAVHVEPGLLAQGDPTLLRVVLENLLGNAWKYSARTRHAQIWLERGEHAGQAVFTVRDNGAGFDMRFADRLFGVFQRLHSASDFPGTGIGLATVRRIVLRHGGEIWAESIVDRGSSFHFTIPAAPAPGS